MTLIRVVAPHFVAGLVLDSAGICCDAAPILAWAIRWRADSLRAYFAKKGWKATVVRQTPST